ncbi:SDR family NAD(P)-dependent oxidoreductase [Roseitalea porphyridii]|uniref:SDR family NAD(P)-dependent oxidoreductase n=1 Tax=Roseitalea porphyridii TaxID=1852022 RepID=A0A4P6V1L1_9HYPH|nr:SDR family NAD(P)-dependent oxidoreductase [Roseitalea porphyridii]QBK30539.1 SDR family NAD(P)-dependent oxidoreductase [Roseitalea porphyridii]
MDLYRIKAGDGVVWITGASAGIGRAVALKFAEKGYDVVASARSKDKLAALAEESGPMLGSIEPFACDVTDREGMKKAVAEIEAAHGPICLAIFNAGNYWPTRGEALDIEAFDKTFGINFFGVLNGLVPAVERMKAHGKGQIVMVGSVSGYSGLPAAAAYGASKAAINNFGESLKFDFDKLNIRVQVVNPGFIDTPLTEKNRFEMPALMPVDKAAAAMVAGIENGGFEITFPRRFTWLLKIMRMMPHPVYFFVMKRAMRWDKQELKFGDTTPASVVRES